ncbi:transcriptional regulator family: Fungal Specific TF [Paecilomyces variotii]|nr:transcriptional regulator family: Fungal Specific TF [Paecilomyces variotii]
MVEDQDQNPGGTAAIDRRKAANRQARSCRVCRLRKVKCDRVKPCHACCAHGHPSKCVYDSPLDEDELQPISQSDEIRNLRAEISELRSRINSQGNRAQGHRRLAELERVFESIRSAPLDVVNSIIWQIRASRSSADGPALLPRPADEATVYPEANPEDASIVTDGPPSIPPRNFPVRGRTPSADSIVDEFTDDGYGTSGGFGASVGTSESQFDDEEQYVCGPVSRFAPQSPALDVFLQRFVDAFSPEVDLSSGRAGAIRAGAEIRMFSPMISNAFEAVSTTFFGRSIQDPRIEASGLKLYPKVLRSLQQALLDPERSRSEATLVTVTLLMAFESIERTTQGSIAAHAMGAMQLFRHRGAENHMYGVEHLLFTELRPYWVGAALVNRRPSFFAEEAWKTIPWSAGTTVKDILHYLLDIVVDIPAVLAQYDDLEASQSSGVLGNGELVAKQTKLWNGVTDLTQRFLQWKKDWVDNYPAGPPKEADSQGDDSFPVFRCRDLRTMKIITPKTLVYPDLRLAQTMCVYYATRLILSSVDTRPTGRVTPAEQYTLACNICRSMECYLRQAPGNMINRLALPVRVAWEALPPKGVEREFMQEIFRLVEKRHSLSLWGSSMPEISPRAGSPPKVEGG